MSMVFPHGIQISNIPLILQVVLHGRATTGGRHKRPPKKTRPN